jgi:MFS family permease
MGGGAFGGAASDRVGRRPILALSLIGGGSSMLLLGLLTTTAAITGIALLTGLLYEMYRPVVSATIADVVAAEDRPRAYGLIYWAVNLGASIAPILGGVIAARSYRALFLADAATTALYGVIVLAALPETRPAAHARPDGAPGAARAVLGDGRLLAVCGLTFAFSIMFFQSFVALPIDVRAHGLSAVAFGALIAINGLLIVFLQPAAGELTRHRSRHLTLAVSSLLLGAGLGMNAWVGSFGGFAVAVAIWTLGEILFAPASQSLVADLAPIHLRGAYQGAAALAFTAAFAAAPALGGYLLAHAGATWLWSICLVTSLLVAAGFWSLGAGERPQDRKEE